MTDKTLDVTNMEALKEKVSDVIVHGNPGRWVCTSKASSKEQGWMKSTKVLQLPAGCLVQVSTQQGDNVAEALTYAIGTTIADFR